MNFFIHLKVNYFFGLSALLLFLSPILHLPVLFFSAMAFLSISKLEIANEGVVVENINPIVSITKSKMKWIKFILVHALLISFVFFILFTMAITSGGYIKIW